MTVRISLGFNYSATMWDFRKQIALDRTAGRSVSIAQLQAPIDSKPIEIALRARDLYLIGIRTGRGQWFEFAADTARSQQVAGPRTAMLPQSRWVKVGSALALSSYRALHLADMIATNRSNFAGGPNALLKRFDHWDGTLNDDYIRLHVCLIIFVICEALRFRQIDNIMFKWTRAATSANGQQPVLSITQEMLDLVQSWSRTSKEADGGIAGGVTAWTSGQPDLLVN